MKLPILITIFTYLLLISCGTVNTESNNEKGKLDLRLWIDPGPAQPSSRETNWTDLLLSVISSENDTVLDTFSIEPSNSFSSFILSKLKSDVQQTISAITTDDIGDTIHGPAIDTFTISPGGTAVISMELFPVKGSMYLMLSHFPSYIDSVLFSFTTPSEIFSIKDRKSTKFYTSLDKISYGLTGTILIAGFDNSGVERLSWSQENFTFTADNITLEADFLDIGSSNLQVTIHEPGKTLIWGIMDDTVAAEVETLSPDSQLIISEIMSSAGSGTTSADYIELFNSSSTYDSLFFPTLVITTANNSYTIENIGIPRGGFYTISGPAVPNQTEWSINQVANLDFTSTSEVITVKDGNGKLYDKVFYVTQGGYMGWPINSSSSRTSLILDTLYTGMSPDYNNYGSNWKKAESVVHENYTDYLGTPGRTGL